MKQIRFNKTDCGVDFLLNVLHSTEVHSGQNQEKVFSGDFFQVVFVRNGTGFLYLNGRKISVTNHAVYFVTHQQRYQWDIDKASFDATILVFQEDFLNEFFSDSFFTYRLHYFYQTKLPLKTQLSPEEFDGYLDRLQEIKQELVTPSVDSAHLIRSVLYYVLVQLNRRYAEEHEILPSNSPNNLAYHFRKLVEKHVKDEQRVEFYAAKMKISRITLNKLVKRHFNLTATDFIKSRLVFSLKMELIYSGHTVKEIADAYAFSEPNHLTRFFKQRVGKSPTQFRLDYQIGS